MAGQTLKKRWTIKEILFLKENYSIMSSSEIAKSLGRNYNSVQKRLSRIYKDELLCKRTYKTQVKYSLNEDSLLKDSHDAYYLMGLIAADGNVCATRNTISIKLKESDSYLLENIKKTFDITRPLYFGISNGFKIGSKYSVLAFNSKPFRQRLIKIGITPAKSKTLNIKEIPQQFFGSFLRGVFDGDGSVCRTKDNSFIVSICSMSKPFMDFIQKTLTYGRVSTDTYGMNTINIRSYERRKFFELIYTDASLKLNRKFLLMTESLNYGNAARSVN